MAVPRLMWISLAISFAITFLCFDRYKLETAQQVRSGVVHMHGSWDQTAPAWNPPASSSDEADPNPSWTTYQFDPLATTLISFAWGLVLWATLSGLSFVQAAILKFFRSSARSARDTRPIRMGPKIVSKEPMDNMAKARANATVALLAKPVIREIVEALGKATPSRANLASDVFLKNLISQWGNRSASEETLAEALAAHFGISLPLAYKVARTLFNRYQLLLASQLKQPKEAPPPTPPISLPPDFDYFSDDPPETHS